MDIITCIKQVPDTSKIDILNIDGSQKDIDKEGLVYKINEWDEYVLETAARAKENLGGAFTAITIGAGEWDEVLRKALAMGADRSIRIDEDVTSADPLEVARILAKAIEGLPYDLILFGAQSEDFNGGQLGGMVAEMLGLSYAAMVVELNISQEKTVRVKRELEAGAFEVYTMKLPTLLTVQTGINQPRYLSISAIRRAMKAELQTIPLEDLGISLDETAPMVKMERIEFPPKGKKAEMISGSPEESAEKLAGILKNEGII